MFFLPHLPSLETQGFVPCVPNLHFKFPRIEEGALKHTSPASVIPDHAGVAVELGASQLIWETLKGYPQGSA